MIKPLEDLEGIGGILAHGCFDLLHIGHIRHLQEAKNRYPDMTLTVTITSDQHISKGPGRPVFSQEIRAESLAALKVVDFVAIADTPSAMLSISTIKPDVYAKGFDYRSTLTEEEKTAIVQYGGLIHYTHERPTGVSSTALLNGDYLHRRIQEQQKQ